MNKVLIVIDVQKFFITKDTKPIIKNIASFLKKNSSKYSAIYFTIFRNDSKAPLMTITKWKDCTGSPDTDICDEIKEFTSDKNLFYKNILSAAKVPQIMKYIKENNISEVHLCGFDTDCCVLATTYDLFDLGIKPVLLQSLTWSTSSGKLHTPAIQMIKRNVGFICKTIV